MYYKEKKRALPMMALILGGGFVFLFLNLFYLPLTPVYLRGDAASYVLNARQMLDGSVLYRDLSQVTLPATEVFYFIIFKFIGLHAWIPNLTLLALGLIGAWLTVVISKAVIPGKAAYLPAALFLVIPFRSQLNPAHHWFSTIAVIAALALMIRGITALRLVGAGALCGVALCFTQSRGLAAVIGLALFLLWAATTGRLDWPNFRRAQLYLWSSFAIVVLLFNAYFALRAGIGTFFGETVLSAFHHGWHFGAYMAQAPVSHPWYRTPAVAIWLSVYALVPLIYLLFFVQYWDQETDRPAEHWDRLMLIAITGAMMFLGVAAEPSFLHLCAVAAPGVILFVWFLNSPGRLRTVRVAAMWALAIGLAVGECCETGLRWHQRIDLPIGRVAVLDPFQYDELSFLLGRVRPGDYAFGSSEIDYLLNLRNPDGLRLAPSDATAAQATAAAHSMGRYPVKYVFWPGALDLLPEAARVIPLRDYVKAHYQLVKIFPNDDTLWAKRQGSIPIPAEEQTRSLPLQELEDPPANQRTR